MIHLEKVIKRYNKSFALGPIDLWIEKGQVIGLLGPNGAGKTTLLKVILGIIKPNSGEINVFGSANYNKIRELSSVVLTQGGFFSEFSAIKNLEMFYNNYSSQEYPFDKLLSQFKLPNKKVSTFSNGMKQRLNIAKSLLFEKELYIYDEPINGLDVEGINVFKNLIIELKNRNKTVIITSHIIAELEKYCTKFIIIKNGKMLINRTKDQIIEQYGSVEGAYMKCYEV